MLGITRRRVLSGVAASVAAAAMVLSVAPPASATPVVAAPLIPEVAGVIGETCAATGPGCAVVAAGALAYGAWWAYTNRDLLLPWLDPTVGAPESATHPQASGGIYVAGFPPNAGPFYRTAGTSEFTLRCENAWCDEWQAYVRCMATNGAVTQGFTYGGTTPVGVVRDLFGSDTSQCSAGSAVVEVDYGWGPDAWSGSFVGRGWWKAGGSWDTQRTVTTTLTCTVPGGATSSYTTTTTDTVTSTRSTTVPNCGTLGPAGSYTSGIKVCDGEGTSSCTPRIDWHTKSGIESTYPNCFTGSSPGYGMCALAVTWAGTACDTTVSQCVDWYTQSAFSATGYGCLWGPYTVPLADCAMLRYSYQPGTSIDPNTGIPTNPAASPSPGPSTSSSSGTFPTTGPNPLPSPSASASGWVSAQPFPSPTGTSTPVPLPPPVIGPNPSGQNCIDAAWGWNPVNWVVVPVECALTWAFVPDQAVVQQTKTDMSNAWTSSPTGTFVSGAWSMLTPLTNLSNGDNGACGLTVDFPYAAGHTTTLHLLDACTAPMSTYAPWVKGFLTAMVLFDGVIACIRALGIGFGIGIPPRAPEQLALF